MQGTATFAQGYWFICEDGPHQIAVFSSSWSGKQKVYFDDTIVAEGRNLTSFNSVLTFDIADDHYEVRYLLTNLMKAEIECLVIKNDRIIARSSQAFYGNKSKMDQVLIGFFAAGAVIGALMVIGKLFLIS